jgi:hypothetical protein
MELDAPRRSTRVRKPVKKFTDEESSVQREEEGQKRKRSIVEKQGEDDFSDEEKLSDEELPWKSAPAKQKKPTKRSKTSRRSKGKISTVEAGSQEPLCQLVEQIKNGDMPISSLVEEWVNNAISDNGSLSIASEIQLIDCCLQTAINSGSIAVKEGEYKSEDPSGAINAMVESVSSIASETYPLLSKDKTMKRFILRFNEFWKAVIIALPEDVLFSDTLENLFEWLVVISK